MWKQVVSKGSFARETGLLLVATVMGNGLGYLYQIFVARALGVEAFGVFGALLGIFYMFTLGGSAYRIEIAAIIARIAAQFGEAEAVKAFLRTGIGLLLILLPVPVVFGVASGVIGSLLHTSKGAILIVGFAVFGTLLLAAALGLLQGLQRFGHLGLIGYVMPPTLKLIFGISFILAGWQLLGALGALLVSEFASLVAAVCPWKKHFSEAIKDARLADIPISKVIFAGLPLAFFVAFPTNFDVVLAVRFFSPDRAGIYAALATWGKIVFFMPLAISLVMVPKVANKHALNQGTRGLGLQGLLLTLLLSGPLVLLSCLFPDVIVKLLFGTAYLGASALIGWYSAAIAVFALNLLLVQYGLAVGMRKYVLLAASLITLAMIPAIGLWHASLWQVIAILLVGNSLLFLTLCPVAFGRAQFRK